MSKCFTLNSQGSLREFPPEVPVSKDEVVEEAAAGVDVGGVPLGRREDGDGGEVGGEDGEDGEEVGQGEVEGRAVEVEGVRAVVAPVEHGAVLDPVVAEYHVL